ncbi:hypothetical protein D9M71_835600 [compost metagenome]
MLTLQELESSDGATVDLWLLTVFSKEMMFSKWQLQLLQLQTGDFMTVFIQKDTCRLHKKMQVDMIKIHL